MNAAFVLFDDLTALDFVGAYDPITRLKTMGFRDDFAWDLCAFREPVELKTSVCTGALLLGAAGFLEGRRATMHPNALDDLTPYCAQVVSDRGVDAGDIITARGVSSSIDLGLHVVERLAGAEVRRQIASQMDYPYA